MSEANQSPRATKHGIFAELGVLARAGRGRASMAVLLLFLSGISDGLSVLSLLPLISLTRGGGAIEQAGVPGELVAKLLHGLGGEPSVANLLLLIVGAVALKGILFVMALRQVGYLAADVAATLRVDIFRSLAKAKWSYLVAQPTGALVNSIGTEAMRVSSLFTETCFLLAMAFQAAVYSLAAFLISWEATLAAGVFGSILLLILRWLMKLARDAGQTETDLLRSLTSRLGNLLGVMKIVKAMARERALQPILEAETRELNVAYRQQVLSRAVNIALQEPFMAAVLAAGFYLALRGGYGTNELLVMAFLFYRIITRVGNAQSHAQNAMIARSAYVAIRSSIDEAHAHAESARGILVPTLEQAISLKGVSVEYEGQYVFRGLTLEIPAGVLTAIVGPSGSGKTTLVDLLVGLVEPSEGDVLVDGTPLSAIDVYKWRSSIGYVGQEAILLHDTIATNVSLGRSEVDESAIVDALRTAYAWDFVARLPDGLSSRVGERGMALSGGQRQRIAIARALVHSPRLLILDEATSALDPDTERAVLDRLRARGRTTVAISHQLGITAFADRTVRLEGGRVSDA